MHAVMRYRMYAAWETMVAGHAAAALTTAHRQLCTSTSPCLYRKKLSGGDDNDSARKQSDVSDALEPPVVDLAPMNTNAERKEEYLRRLFPRKGVNAAMKEARAKLVDMDKLEEVSAALVDRNVLEYPLHTVKVITPSMVASVKAHNSVFMFSSIEDDAVMRSQTMDLEVMLTSRVRGNALYFRVVHLDDEAPSGGGVGSSSSEKLQLRHTQREQIFGLIEALLQEYAVVSIQPFPLEIACDITHYCAAAPLVHAGQKHVAQVVEDVKRIISKLPIEKEGCAPTPTEEELEPLNPERVASEIAARIRAAVFSGSSPSQLTDLAGLRVCIGAAPTPALAKIACDTEVGFVRKYRDVSAAAPVRIRSFHTHMRTSEDTRKFLAHFKVAHIPTFTPAFTRLLSDAFNVTTCEDLYNARDLLQFSLSKETYQECYAAVFGCMRFQEETRTVMLCGVNLSKQNSVLMDLATNAISVVNKERTAPGGLATSISHYRLATRGVGCTDTQLIYGRLMSDEQFTEVVRRLFATLCRRLQRKGYTTKALRLDLRCSLSGYKSKSFSLTFPPTNNHEVMMELATEAARLAAPHREHKGVQPPGCIWYVHLVFQKLELAKMLPVRLDAEIERLVSEYKASREKLSYFWIEQRKNSSPVRRERVNRNRRLRRKALREEMSRESSALAPVAGGPQPHSEIVCL